VREVLDRSPTSRPASEVEIVTRQQAGVVS
jgi:hypothetical protein